MILSEVIESIGKIIDGLGVAVIVIGFLIATAGCGLSLRRQPGSAVYSTYRRRLGRAILLGLEFLVAADIIRTVAVDPSLESVAVLGGIVAIRTFLSIALELEINGRWPWQPRAATKPSTG
ncbi:MAG: DUF1622 domain-containing protein [Actinomycetota bacterium]|nr:DUF1622 domain-containing protein [Actinomycetota bacterium]